MSQPHPLRADRRRIIKRLKRLRKEIEIDFNTAAYWNENVRKPHEEPIDFDPFGEMRRLATAIDELLLADTGTGPIPPLHFTRSH